MKERGVHGENLNRDPRVVATTRGSRLRFSPCTPRSFIQLNVGPRRVWRADPGRSADGARGPAPAARSQDAARGRAEGPARVRRASTRRSSEADEYDDARVRSAARLRRRRTGRAADIDPADRARKPRVNSAQPKTTPHRAGDGGVGARAGRRARRGRRLKGSARRSSVRAVPQARCGPLPPCPLGRRSGTPGEPASPAASGHGIHRPLRGRCPGLSGTAPP